MKKLIFSILCLLVFPGGMMAQYSGGIGRGDFTLPCINPINGGTIASEQPAWSGADPSLFTSTALPTGHTGTLEYKWQQSTTSNSTGFSDIINSNSVTYNPPIITATTWYKRLARVTCQADWFGAAESNTLVLTVYSFGDNAVTGLAVVCPGATHINYAVTTDNSATATYQWFYTGANASLSSTSGHAISIDFAANSTSGYLSVIETVTETHLSTINFLAVTVAAAVSIDPFSPASITRNMGARPFIAQTTAHNQVGDIVYTLDAPTLASPGNSINPVTGEVILNNSWCGTATVRATATGCTGPATTDLVITVNLTTRLDIKVMLEGAVSGAAMLTSINSRLPLTQPYTNSAPFFYTGTESVTSIPAGVVDWILVEVRQATDPSLATSSTILARRAGFLKSDGTIVDPDGLSRLDVGNLTVTNNLYVVLRHRNHLAVMSATGILLSNGVYSYDFTTGLAKAYGGGSGFKQVGSKFAMVAGDINRDGNIFVTDYNSWASSFGITNGYFNADLTMDGNVFVTDYNKWATNFGATIDLRIKSLSTKPRYFSCIPK